MKNPLLLSIKKTLHKAYCSVLDFMIPHTCLQCKIPVCSYGLCAECFSGITLISDPKCYRCGFPFPNRKYGKICAKCIKDPIHCITRSAVVYNQGSKPLILHLKHSDGQELAPFIADKILTASKDITQKAHIILPVPLHYKRLLKRKYNQASLLAIHMAKRLKIPLYVNTLIRIKDTQPQGKKTFAARKRNIKGAFFVNCKYNDTIKDKCILLVDDVFTSGATLNECAKILLKAGAKDVIAATYARVP